MTSEQTKKALLKICAGGFMLLILGFVAYYLALPEKTVEQRSAEYKQELKKGASAATHLLIEEYLKTTSRVQHPVFGEPGESIAISRSNVYIVTSWVAAEDPRGELRQKHYTATVKYLQPKDAWKIITVKFTEQN